MAFRLKAKYGNKRTRANGRMFDSAAEARYYSQALLMERNGDLKILELQPKVYLTDAKILYKPDFLLEIDGMKIFVDVKGNSTAVFNLKARLWKHYGPGPLWVVNSNDFNTKKEILPIKGENYVTD